MDVVVWLRSLGLGKYGRRRARCRYHRFASRAHENTTGSTSTRLSQFPDIATQTKTPAMLVLTGACDGKLL
jgi:hypothetical protein